MDYVLFGMGYGATLMLLGWALRTFGPQLKYSRSPQDEDASFTVERRFWVRFIQGLGGVIAIAGTTMVLLTFVVVLVNPNDDTGGTIAMAIWAFILLAVVLWCGIYVKRFGLTGIWSRQGGYGFRRSTGTASPPRQTGSSMRTLRPEKRLTSEPETIGFGPAPTEPAVPLADTEPVDEHAVAEAETPAVEPEISQPEQGNDPVYDFGDVSDTTVPADAGGRAEALRRLRERQARARHPSS